MNLQKTKLNQRCKLAVSLLFVALLTFTSTASAQLTVTGDSQLGTSLPFTPSWTPVTGGLLDNQTPTSFVGDFGEYGTGGNVNNLTTVGESIQIRNYAGAGNLEMCGDDGNATTAAAGRNVVYTLPASAHGYNLTNITVYGGWQDAGRDAQEYTILYSTVADPTRFFVLTTVVYNPVDAGGQPSATRVTVNDLSGAPIATNVAALKFDFASMGGENRSAGLHAITAFGNPASGPVSNPNLTVTGTSETGAAAFTPDWTVETPDLIAGQSPSTQSGDFGGGGGFGTDPSVSPSILTDGNPGTYDTYSTISDCGSSAGSSVVYTLTNNTSNAYGMDVTNIVVYNGWADGGRDGQYYTISYSSVASPSAFIPVTTVFYSPDWNGNAIANRVAIHNSDGSPLALNVASLKFNFASPPSAGNFYHAFQGYGEIVVQGVNSLTNSALPPSPVLAQDTLPSYAETVVGDQVVFSAAYSNSIPANLQWQKIVTAPAATNNINIGVATVTNNGVVTSTLTLNNLQLADSGSYRLEAINATNILGVVYSAVAPLVVSNTPAPINNVIVNYAAQTFVGSTNFFPPWPVDTNHLNLIYGFTDGSGPGTFVSVGDFSLDLNQGTLLNGDVTNLCDGVVGPVTSVPNLTYSGGGNHTYGAGEVVTYTLNPAPFGLDITNITVFGGWWNADHNGQKYQVLYSTVSSPATFVPLLTADYAPGESSNDPVVSRTTLVPVNGVMAHNVAALKFNFSLSPNVKNGWSGYSEILVGGKPATGIVPPFIDFAPNTASDVVGGQIILKAVFSNYTSLQWVKNGTNLVGANSLTLTLNNLQLTDAGSYVLAASNANGTSFSSACPVTVNPAPTATSNIITAIATQTSIAEVFTPTWDTNVLTSSLINNVSPSSSGDGDFTGGTFGTIVTGGSQPSVLTDGTFGTIDFNQTGLHAWVTCIGSGTGNNNSFGGNFVTYTLPASPNGYNITNIMTAGGWNDTGRDQQSYTVSYATFGNPTFFIPLMVVSYNPVGPVGYSMNRATITPANGILASNVVALQFDMSTPAGENGYSGYSEIAAYGSPSATPPPAGLVITTEHQEDSTSWTAETPNLIANQLPSSQGAGVFTEEGCNVTNLTDGVLGFGAAFGASCGDDGIAVPYIVFNSASGWDLTNIVVYTLWHDYGRDGQFYNLSYSTWSAPATFLPLASVRNNPPMPHDGRNSGLRVAIAPQVGQTLIASNVAAVKFDFTPQGTQDFSWSGYSEIVLQGSNLTFTKAPVVDPVRVSGGNLILTGTGGTPNSGYTWLTTTNLQTPLASWTTNTTGLLDGNGAFSNAIPINASIPARFFRLRLP